MVRQKTSPPEDLISLTSRLPWWVCILLAIISYFVLHMIASRPAMTIVGPGQMGDAVTKGIVTTFAMFFQYIFPFAFTHCSASFRHKFDQTEKDVRKY